MNSKAIIATVAAAVVGFFAGFLLFGLALDPWYKHNSINYEGLYNEMPDMITLFAAHIVFAALLVYVLSLAGIKAAMKGFIVAAIVSALVMLSIDLFMSSMMNLWVTQMVIVVDTLANAVWGGLMGATAAWVLGKEKKAAVATAA